MKKLYFLVLLVCYNAFAKPFSETKTVAGPAIGLQLIGLPGISINFMIISEVALKSNKLSNWNI